MAAGGVGGEAAEPPAKVSGLRKEPALWEGARRASARPAGRECGRLAGGGAAPASAAGGEGAGGTTREAGPGA